MLVKIRKYGAARCIQTKKLLLNTVTTKQCSKKVCAENQPAETPSAGHALVLPAENQPAETNSRHRQHYTRNFTPMCVLTSFSTIRPRTVLQACSVTITHGFAYFGPGGLKGYAVQRHFWHFFRFVNQIRAKAWVIVTLQIKAAPKPVQEVADQHALLVRRREIRCLAVVLPLRMFCVAVMYVFTKCAKNAFVQPTPLSLPPKSGQKHT